MCYVKPEELDSWKPPLEIGRDQIFSKLDEYVGEMLEAMKRLSETGKEYIDIYFHPKVMDEINSYAKTLDMTLRKEPTDVNIYRQSFWEHLAKLSMLNAIARNQLDKVSGEYVVNVSPDARAFTLSTLGVPLHYMGLIKIPEPFLPLTWTTLLLWLTVRGYSVGSCMGYKHAVYSVLTSYLTVTLNFIVNAVGLIMGDPKTQKVFVLR